MGYKYFIKQRGKQYYFGLYPNNNNRQPIAISGNYDSYEKAKEGISQLVSMLNESSDLFGIKKVNRGYVFALKENPANLFFYRTLPIEQRSEVSKCIARVYNNYTAPLKINDERDSYWCKGWQA